MNSIEDILNMIATEAFESAYPCPDCKAIPPNLCKPWCSSFIDNQIMAISETTEEQGAESEIELCQRALDGDKQSREECVRILKYNTKNKF